MMLLTSKQLAELEACDRWLNIFNHRYPEGLLLETKDDLVKAISLGGFAPVLDFITGYMTCCGLEHLLDKNGDLDLTYSNFNNAHLLGFTAHHVNFTGSNFYEADLRLAHFHCCKFSNTEFCLASLSGASITYCDFTSASLSYADIRNTHIANSSFNNTDLKQASFNSETSWLNTDIDLAINVPPGFKEHCKMGLKS